MERDSPDLDIFATGNDDVVESRVGKGACCRMDEHGVDARFQTFDPELAFIARFCGGGIGGADGHDDRLRLGW